MITAFDCHYTEDYTIAAYCSVPHVNASEPIDEGSRQTNVVSAYVPGEFYKRELKPILDLIDHFHLDLGIIIVDGYVDLATGRAGLGRHLYIALGEAVPVIGVAKNPFKESDTHVEVFRGGSTKPLYITAAGLENRVASEMVSGMSGKHRMPTLLKRVDQLARGRP